MHRMNPKPIPLMTNNRKVTLLNYLDGILFSLAANTDIFQNWSSVSCLRRISQNGLSFSETEEYIE